MINSTNDSILRNAATRQGYSLKKSRSNSCDNRGGYMVVDSNNVIVAGEKFDLTPEEVKDWLNQS